MTQSFTGTITRLLALFSLLGPSANALERLEPASGCYIGMLLDDQDSIGALSSRLGLTPATFSRFYAFPLDAAARQSVSDFLDQVRTSGGIAMLTLEPFSGLGSVTPAHCDDFANLCAQKEAQGIGGIMVRFAHEMNGNWYAWCQQPALYRQKFQLIANSVHSRTTRTAMVWTPNNGIGYPFGTGAFSAAAGSPNFLELDTNNDGTLTQADDMFGPFYPGDTAVDWVGLSIYHWGVTYPWLENEPPYASEFANVMNATGPGVPANYSRWFYSRYCSDGIHDKPLIIAETSAFYNTEQPGANEVAMKQAWFRQLYNISGASADGPDVATSFPKMKCINWFDHYKRESEAQNQIVDWRASANPIVRNAFVTSLRTLRGGQPYFLTAQEFGATQNANNIIATEIPAILPLSGSVAVTLSVKAQNSCDLAVDLLDQNFNFKGGVRVAVPAGTNTIPVSLTLNSSLIDGSAYRWSIFLTPTGGNHLNALSRYTGPDPVARAVAPFLSIVSGPLSTPSTAAFTSRVQYVAAGDATIGVTLLNSSGIPRGSGMVNVKRGSGLLDIIVSQLVGNPTGAYTLRGTLTNPALLAQTAELPIQIAAAPTANSVSLAVEPGVVPSGEVFRFTVAYSTTVARDLRLEFSNPAGTLLSTAVQAVVAGSKSIDMTISQPLAVAGTHTARIYLVPTGGTPAQAVASSPAQTLHIVSPDYSKWTMDRWGVLLASDPIGPQLDPDGDGSTNSGEYAALTDPRNPSSILRPHITRSGSALTVSWPSSTGRTYQVFARPSLATGSWLAANGLQNGTGGTMTYNASLTTSGAINFYRVQVSLP